MQEIEVGIDELRHNAPTDMGGQAAVSALIEGDASNVGWRIQARVSGTSPGAADWQAYYDELDDAYLEQLNTSSTPLATTLDNNTIGGRFIAMLGTSRVAVL